MRHVLRNPAVIARRSLAVALFTSLTLAACAVGPNYHRPSAASPQRFKEAEGWKPAEPREAASGTDWWSIYGDATLDELEKQIDISNQNLRASEAAWRQATALVSQARALMAEGKLAEACPKLAESQRLDARLGTMLDLADRTVGMHDRRAEGRRHRSGHDANIPYSPGDDSADSGADWDVLSAEVPSDSRYRLF